MVISTRTVADGFATVQLDLETNEQTLLYDGMPIAGELPRCVADMAFDSLRNRILYYNQATGSCVEGYYAVDVDSSATERLFGP